MVIQKIYIKGFGGLKEREFLLSDGLNIIYGENESGKSTIAEFIRAILYGIDSGVRNIRENERLHYMPLDGSVMGGSLEVEHDGRMYLISRTFGKTKSKDKLSVTDAVTGAELDLTPEDLIGIDNSSFMKTLYIRQLSTKVEGSKNDEILKKLINLSQTGEEEASYQNARTLLNNALKGLNSKAKGIIPRINQEIADLQTERAESIRAEEKLARIEQEIIEYKKQQDLLHKKLQEKSEETKYTQQYEKWSNIKEQAELKEKLEKEKQDNTRLQLETKIDALSGKKNIYLVLFIISLMLFTCGYFITPLLVFSAVSAVFLIYYLKTNKKINAIREEIKEIGKDTCNKPCDDVKYKQWFMDELGSDDFERIPDLIENYSKLFKERQLSYNQQIVELAEKIRDKENEKNNMPNRAVAAIDQDITMKSNQLNAYIQKESAIKNAIEALDYAFDQLQQNFAPKLNRHTSRVLSEITEGKYKEVRADNVYNLTLIDSKGEAISADYLSTGCYDQIYFALRMGMIELLDIDAPIILDDAFAFYDENRLQRAMDYIKKLQRQLILFTCQRREKGGNMFNL